MFRISAFRFPPPRLTRGKELRSSDQILIRNISLKLSRLLSPRVKMQCNLFRRDQRSCLVFFVTHKTLSTLQLFGVKLLQTLLNNILRPHHLYSSQLPASFMIRGSYIELPQLPGRDCTHLYPLIRGFFTPLQNGQAVKCILE